MTQLTFDKYRRQGAYHWEECDLNSKSFNPPLIARYWALAREVLGARRILDIGSGDGYLSSLLSGADVDVIGIENDSCAVKIAANKLVDSCRCEVIRGNCYQLPIASDTCDAVVMADVIEHLEDPNLALGEATRVLVPYGKLALTTPKWRPDRVWDKLHVQEFKSYELRKLLETWFERVEIRYFWPLRWSKFYSTRLGWRATKIYARHVSNPFMRLGSDERRFGQMLAVCTGRKRPVNRHTERLLT